VYEDEEVAGKEPQPKVNYCLIMPPQAFREASLERSHSTTRCRMKSVEALCWKSGASRDSMALGCDEIRVDGSKELNRRT
jgi:hypothetical protein